MEVSFFLLILAAVVVLMLKEPTKQNWIILIVILVGVLAYFFIDGQTTKNVRYIKSEVDKEIELDRERR